MIFNPHLDLNSSLIDFAALGFCINENLDVVAKVYEEEQEQRRERRNVKPRQKGEQVVTESEVENKQVKEKDAAFGRAPLGDNMDRLVFCEEEEQESGGSDTRSESSRKEGGEQEREREREKEKETVGFLFGSEVILSMDFLLSKSWNENFNLAFNYRIIGTKGPVFDPRTSAIVANRNFFVLKLFLKDVLAFSKKIRFLVQPKEIGFQQINVESLLTRFSQRQDFPK